MRPLDLRLVLPLCLGVVVPSGCDEKKAPDPATPEASSTPAAESPRAAAEPGPRMPALEVPAGVPADVAGVLIARTPESIFATVTSFDLLGDPDASDVDALRKELDEYLTDQIGMTVTDVDRVTVFFTPKTGLAAIVEGTKGDPKGRAVGEHEGQTLYELAGVADMVATRQGDDLVLGQREAVQQALSAAAGGASLAEAKGPLFELLTEDSKNVTLAVAAEAARLPEDLQKEARRAGIERAAIHYDAKGLRVTAMGTPGDIAGLAKQVEMGLAMMVSGAESEKTRTLEGDDPVEGVAMIMAHHSARRLQKMLVPQIDGGRMVFDVPIRMADPALLTAVAGAGAAIAIPAFTKYTRRSKTSEARVQIAKMFDAASSFFNEEHVERSAVALIGGGGTLPTSAPHRCPNDGRLEGSAGVTPPLSVDCSKGPGGRCVPVAGEPRGPGEYSMSAWTDNNVWNGLNFQQEQGHVFHYDFRWKNADSGFGECQFTAQAFGDLDGDGVFSTYERSGAGDENGVNAAAGLYIDREIE